MSTSNFLTNEEVDALVIGMVRARPATEDEMLRLIRFAEHARLENSLIDLVIEGDMTVYWDQESGELVWNVIRDDDN